jgi:hypothetical protein
LPLGAFDVVIRFVLVLVEADVIENEELRLRPDVRLVGHAGGTHVGFGLARHVARVLGIILPRDRVLNVARHRQGLAHERIDHGRVRLGDDEHVALVDRLPAAHGGPVEAESVLERLDREGLHGDGEMLLRAGKIHEPQIHGQDFLLAAQGQNFTRCHGCRGARWRRVADTRNSSPTRPDDNPGPIPRQLATPACIGTKAGRAGNARRRDARCGNATTEDRAAVEEGTIDGVRPN